MAIPVIMPRVGQSVESSIIVKWNKNVGDNVSSGDVLFSFETDKAEFEEEAKESGVMLARFFEEGDDVPCMTNVCVIGKPGEGYDEFIPGEHSVKEAIIETEQTPSKVASEIQKSKTPTIVSSDELIKISPRAKKLAEKNKVDYRMALPSGAEGRITERDVKALIDSGIKFTGAALTTAQSIKDIHNVKGSGIGGRVTLHDITRSPDSADSQRSELDNGGYEEIKLTNIRKTIARNMQQSLATTAQLTNHSSFDATEVEQLRDKLRTQGEPLKLAKITLTDIILFAVSRTLRAHKVLNAHFLEDRILCYNDVHLGLAVDTEKGLMVPTVFNADKKSLNEIAKETKELAKQCREGSINPDFLVGATFTVSNLGSFGVEIFTPIINPPQTGILGVCSMKQTPRSSKNGEIELYNSIGLSLTYDHRVVDGAPAARFQQSLIYNLENFTLLLAR